MIYMDATKKKNIGIISFVPILAFILTFIYEYREVGRLLAVGDHHAVMDEICGCYDNLVLMYSIAVVLTLAGGSCKTAAIALTNVGETPLYAAEASQAAPATALAVCEREMRRRFGSHEGSMVGGGSETDVCTSVTLLGPTAVRVVELPMTLLH